MATFGLGELFGGGVDSPVMEEDPEEEGPGESTIIHLKFIFMCFKFRHYVALRDLWDLVQTFSMY